MEYQYNDPYLNCKDNYKYIETFKKYVKLIVAASKITNFENFCNVIDEVNKNNKEEFEEAIIVLFKLLEAKSQLEVSKSFFKKYKRYLNVKLEKNPKEFYNNLFCWYILTTKYTGKSEEFDYLIVKKKQKNDMIEKEVNKIIDKINNNEAITKQEKHFIENYMIITTKQQSIASDMLFEYFKRYPIENLDTNRNRQLFLLSVIAKKLSEVGIFVYIALREEIDFKERIGGFAGSLSDGMPVIVIHEIDERLIQNDKKLFEDLYVVYHEIGHIIQNNKADMFSLQMQEIFKREHFIKKMNLKFYSENHDYFMIERNANEYAITEIMKDYPDNEILRKRCEKEKKKLEQLDKTKTNYFDIELQEYQRLSSKQHK